MTQDTQTTNGTIWLMDADDPMDGTPTIEGDGTRIEVERTAEDELAIHATMPGDSNALVSLYMTPAEAALIAAHLAAASVAPYALPAKSKEME